MSLIIGARRRDDSEPGAVTDVEFRARVEAIVNPQIQQILAESAQLRAENAHLSRVEAIINPQLQHMRVEAAHMRAANAQLRDRLDHQEERISRLEELLLR
jgi:hypothetical protein